MAEPLDEEDKKVAEWIQAQQDAEVERLKDCGQRIIPMKAKNFCVMRKKKSKSPTNRIEVASGFNFGTIGQLLVSDPVPCPHRDGSAFVNVVLLKSGPKPTIPLLLPFLYETTKTNDLKEWCFVNQSGKETVLRVNEFA